MVTISKARSFLAIAILAGASLPDAAQA